jgi:hypothetical protein
LAIQHFLFLKKDDHELLYLRIFHRSQNQDIWSIYIGYQQLGMYYIRHILHVNGRLYHFKLFQLISQLISQLIDLFSPAQQSLEEIL